MSSYQNVVSQGGPSQGFIFRRDASRLQDRMNLKNCKMYCYICMLGLAPIACNIGISAGGAALGTVFLNIAKVASVPSAASAASYAAAGSAVVSTVVQSMKCCKALCCRTDNANQEEKSSKQLNFADVAVNVAIGAGGGALGATMFAKTAEAGLTAASGGIGTCIINTGIAVVQQIFC